LLEPQRSSLTNFSEQFDNAYWNKAGVTILANNTISPDGYTNADKITSSGAGGDEYIQRAGFTTTAGTYTSSIFVKNVNATVTVLMAVHIGEGSITSDMRYNWSTNTFVLNGTNAVAGKATSYGNGWVRLEFTYTIGALVTDHWFRTYVQTGVSTNSIFIYGAQLEAGAYATSYIPTLGTSVTRVKDAASKSSASAIIGQTEGVIFTEVVLKERSQQICILTSGAGNEANRVQVYGDGTGKIGFLRGDGSAVILSSSTYALGTTLKIAAAYKANDFVLYINGVLQGSDTSVTAPVTPSVIYLGQYVDGTGYSSLDMSQLLLFQTRLSNSDLAALTA
jgi:hypothetical protein